MTIVIWRRSLTSGEIAQGKPVLYKCNTSAVQCAVQMTKADSKAVSFRLKSAVVWAIEDLAAQWECSQTAAVEKAILRAHGHERSAEVNEKTSAALQVVANTPPRRESGLERAQREKQERYERTAALDSVDDPSIDRSDEYVSN